MLLLAYLTVGFFSVREFYFSPWWRESWQQAGWVLGWALAGIFVDPFKLRPVPASSLLRLPAQWFSRLPLLHLILALSLHFSAWAIRSYWYLPWLAVCEYWIARDILLGFYFTLWTRNVFPKLSDGRRICIVLLLLVLSHLLQMLAYAGASGTPEFLQDGETQKFLLHELWFKLIAGPGIYLSIYAFERRQNAQANAAVTKAC